MIRPVLALGVLVALAGCSSVDETSAASVDGTDVSIEEFEALLTEVVDHPGIFGVEQDEATGTVSAGTGRQLLSLMVQAAASEQFLATSGESITDEDRQAARETLGESAELSELSEDFQALIVELQAATSARGRIAAPDAAELEQRYASSPESLGVFCVRQVALDTEQAAADVLEELAAGADIETLARERSIDPTAADNGGAIEIGGQACVSNSEAVAAGVPPQLVAAAVTSTPGRPVGPVQTDVGWHVVEARPYDEVAESLASRFEESAGDLLYNGFLVTSDVRVDPRYGRWSGASASIVPLA